AMLAGSNKERKCPVIVLRVFAKQSRSISISKVILREWITMTGKALENYFRFFQESCLSHLRRIWANDRMVLHGFREQKQRKFILYDWIICFLHVGQVHIKRLLMAEQRCLIPNRR